VGRRLLWILLAGLGIALLILIARHEQGTIGPLTTYEFSSLAYLVALLVFLGGSVLIMFRHQFAKALEAALFWLALGLVLTLVYTYRFELRSVAERVLAELVPGYTVTRTRTVEVQRSNTGEFPIAAQVNGARVPMVLDTGASTVVLTRDDAKAAGLPLEVLAYTVNVDTANGRTRAAPVTLDRVAVGGLVERSVQALIAQPGALRVSLLGMSFLNRLQSWEVRGDKLMLRGYP
jgi:aspartyl protease family protein